MRAGSYDSRLVRRKGEFCIPRRGSECKPILTIVGLWGDGAKFQDAPAKEWGGRFGGRGKTSAFEMVFPSLQYNRLAITASRRNTAPFSRRGELRSPVKRYAPISPWLQTHRSGRSQIAPTGDFKHPAPISPWLPIVRCGRFAGRKAVSYASAPQRLPAPTGVTPRIKQVAHRQEKDREFLRSLSSFL